MKTFSVYSMLFILGLCALSPVASAKPILLTDSVTDKPTQFVIQWRLSSDGTSTYDGNYWKLSLTGKRTEAGPTEPENFDMISLVGGQHKKPVPGHEEADDGPSDIFSLLNFRSDFINFSGKKPISHGDHLDIWTFSQIIRTEDSSIKIIRVEAAHVVPEPSTLLLSLSALALLGLKRIRSPR